MSETRKLLDMMQEQDLANAKTINALLAGRKALVRYVRALHVELGGEPLINTEEDSGVLEAYRALSQELRDEINA